MATLAPIHRMLFPRVPAGRLATSHASPRSVAAAGATFCAFSFSRLFTFPKRRGYFCGLEGVDLLATTLNANASEQWS